MEGANKNNPESVQEEGQNPFIDTGQIIRRCLRAQSLGGLALAGALALVNPVAAYSSLFGSLAAYIPALLFAVISLRRLGQESGAFLRAAVVGEAVKLLVMALICMMVFMWVEPLSAGWFFAGMIVVILIGYLGLIFGH